MPKRRPKKPTGPLKVVNQHVNVLQSNKRSGSEALSQDQKPVVALNDDLEDKPILGLRSFLEDENCKPGCSSSIVENLSTDAAALYDDLDSFRQKWKRELEVNKQTENLESLKLVDNVDHKSSTNSVEKGDQPEQPYIKAKKLFLMAVELERDEMHHESIRYYKQAMRLCPDIEKQIFKEECEASARSSSINVDRTNILPENSEQLDVSSELEEKIPLYDRIVEKFNEDNQQKGFAYCRPSNRHKSGNLHISELPIDLIVQIMRYVVGQDLDLASLETIGRVCRGFYVLSKEPSLWRNICHTTWGHETINEYATSDAKSQISENIDWRLMYLNRPRVNYDGVYISRTRYIRQGDVGFQGITYRPFHMIRYYRYLRFFPDKRVLILTTNEEPDKIIPIFRHALHSKQFSPEMSILEGVYEFVNNNQINIVAEKNYKTCAPAYSQNQRARQAQFHWSKQSPIAQKINLKFELKTVDTKPYKNNVLKWLEYTLLTRRETGQEVTSFDLSPDTFPNLLFSRVRRLNLRLTNPLQNEHRRNHSNQLLDHYNLVCS